MLYPSFRATIRGEYYGIVTIDDIDEECYNIAKRAIAAFKFPKISTQYVTYYAIRSKDPDENNTLEEVDEDTEGAIPHAYFVNNLSYAELEVILAWMKFYWCEEQISNADNFEDGTWVNITGIIEKGKYHNEEIPIINSCFSLSIFSIVQAVPPIFA